MTTRNVRSTALIAGFLLSVLLTARDARAQSATGVGVGAGETKLAAFSLRRAFAESTPGKAGIARLNAFEADKSRELEERNRTLQAREQELQSSLPLLSAETRTEREKELEKFRLDVQRFIEDAQAEFLGVRRDVEAAFLLQVRPALDKVARDKGLLVVFNLDNDSVAWIDPSLDVTPDVVKQLAIAEVPALR